MYILLWAFESIISIRHYMSCLSSREDVWMSLSPILTHTANMNAHTHTKRTHASMTHMNYASVSSPNSAFATCSRGIWKCAASAPTKWAMSQLRAALSQPEPIRQNAVAMGVGHANTSICRTSKWHTQFQPWESHLRDTAWIPPLAPGTIPGHLHR